MKCPKCNNESGIEAINIPGSRDRITYQLRCLKCNCHWRDHKPGWIRASKEEREKILVRIKEKWSNVVFIDRRSYINQSDK